VSLEDVTHHRKADREILTGTIFYGSDPVGTFKATLKDDICTFNELLILEESAQGLGVGTQVVRAMQENYLRHCKEIRLTDPLPHAIPFWERMGFVKTGEIDKHGFPQMRKVME
jgi:GNAT superfamily N-acetyltransferase